ncbi:protein kinase domain-containing protein, partial [Escherichia coli]|uniref:protein kinase domain-containing protein n=1 Tax=Escherichia coli TaxID=562 RepID=UPI00159BDC82
VPVRIASAILVASLHGLHAAHEAKSESGEPLGIVHRDVSPQNILVGADGVVRVLDFGIAKAMGRLHTTRDGQVKGKAGYMAPEQLRGAEVDPRTDVYSASVVLWEVL